MIKRVAKHAFSNQVDSKRYDDTRQPIPIEKRDITWENAMLFLRDMLLFREYEDAVKDGDTGRIEHVPDDMFGEYVVRENKKRQRPLTNATSGDFNKEINACQVMCYRYSQSAMYSSTGATDYYMCSAQADSWAHIEKFYTDLLNAEVSTRLESRYKLREQDEAKFHISPDLYITGAVHIGTGEPVAKYKARARCTWSIGLNGIMPSHVEDDSELLDGYESDQAEQKMLEFDIW
ncbi:hypothetical protein FN846DRAFT_914551 [Sphaerosporella brunnea]|uniref:DUF6589 domain-containing protein n=1 Tax=Sphaerosporella brunnea TaxID=1250544 RepID=A0A5J5ECR7_9PEZI|nr:hypothetical protein FN846DRAFT_914551 [Sphaerosporella brunnea]